MKPKEIQELLDFIASSGLAEVNIETEQFKISVKKNSDVVARTIELPVQALPQMIANTPMATAQPLATIQPPNISAPVAEKPAKETTSTPATNTVTIKSPMIGTFYRSSSPDSPSFVNVGDEIKPGQTVCIIEAMKLFNEIESEFTGRVVKVLVENATPVEYDQPLFILESL